MRIKLLVSYDGTAYCGWQIQPNGITVQEILENAVHCATGEMVRVTGSGRTDAGVHALGQVAHFDTESTIPPQKFYRALNVHLPSDIRVLASEKADDNFHACSNAKKKTYAYSFYISETELPLKERYAVQMERTPDFEKMKRAAELFVGEHDFKGFCASGSGAKTTVRTVYGVDIKVDGKDITLSVSGNGFLYNMVRIMAGTILAVGYGEITEEDVKNAIITGKRINKVKTLPAKALCLVKVEYE